MSFFGFSLRFVMLLPSVLSTSLIAQGPVGGSTEAKAVPAYAEVEAIVAANCLGCHSPELALGDIVLDTEEKLNSWRLESLNALKAGLMPVGDEGFKDTADGQLLLEYLESLEVKEVVYADIAPVLQANCLSCHRGASARKGVRLDTEAFAIQNASRSLPTLTQGRMPPRKPGFKDTSEGQLLLEWFQKPLATPKP